LLAELGMPSLEAAFDMHVAKFLPTITKGVYCILKG
jgi:hypothetical protein